MKRYFLQHFYLAAIALLAVQGLVFHVSAQDGLSIRLKKHTYIDVNTASGDVVHDVRDNVLGVMYTDNFGRNSEIVVNVYDWTNTAVGTFILDKRRGLNKYSIDLTKLNTPVQPDHIYYFRMKDENGFGYAWSIRPVNKPVGDIQAAIRVNPKRLLCGQAEGNLVEFYSEIQGDRGPYSVSWYVLNEMRSEFLYQPRNEALADANQVSVIQVDKSPSYYVMLDVTDACGNTAKKMVYIECQKNRKKINTLFVEPIDNLSEVVKNVSQ